MQTLPRRKTKMLKSLIFTTEAVAPIILTVAIGYILKRLGIIPESLTKPLNKLVFRVLLPCLLFVNIYNISDFSTVRYGYIIYAVAATVIVFLLSLFLSRFATDERRRRGVLTQCAFRSNYALIGIPLATSLGVEGGAAIATLLSAVAIPLFNVLAVIALSVFGEGGEKTSVRKVLLGIVKNPLIQGVFAGLTVIGIRALFVLWGVSFRLSDVTVVFDVLDFLSRCATPIALLVLGAQFKFSAIGGMRREIIIGTLARSLIVPMAALAVAYFFFKFTGAEFAAFVAMFATPVAVSSVPMAQEMGSDPELGGQLVIWTTIGCGVSLFLFIFALKLLHVF